MKNLILIGLITAAFVLPCFSQNYDNAGMDFTKAVYENKTPETRITALLAYIKKYTDTSNKFVRMAHYQLATNYFQNKDYSQAIRIGEKSLNFNYLGEGELGRLNLIIANSYGIKGSASYNTDKALKYTNAAIRIARSKGDNDVLKAANDLKNKLSGPPPKKVNPERKIKMMYYQDEDYRGAIQYYYTLGSSDKSKPEIHNVYANALFKANRLDAALKEFNKIYSDKKKGMTASRIAEIYAKKAKRNQKLFDSSVNYYLEAGFLFKAERNRTKEKTAFKKAEYQLFEKYGFNEKTRKLQKAVERDKSNAEKNKMEIIRLKRLIRQEERRIRAKYTELEPPEWELENINKYKKQIQNLESGASPASIAQAKKLEEEKARIKKEYDDLYNKVKEKMAPK